MQIYKVTNIINDRFYIGKEKRNNKNYLGSGIMINNAIKKYGRENFKKEIIQVYETEEEWNNAERYWIKELNSFYPIGYNIGEGGEGGDNISKNPNKDNIRKKMRQGHKEAFRPYLTDEQRRQKSENAKEYNAKGLFGRKGQPHTLETKQKISETAKKYVKTDEHCLNISKGLKGKSWEDKVGIERAEVIKQQISKARKGVPRTEETKNKLSESHKGQIPWNKGKMGFIYTEERKKNIGLANKGKVRTEEQRKRISEANKGKKRTEEQRKRISEGLKGKSKSEEHRRKNSESHKDKTYEDIYGIEGAKLQKEKISRANKGEKNSFYGKHHTPESIEKIKESMKMRFIPYVSTETRLKMSEARKGKKYKKAV